jgi:hypothetical protein
MPEASGTAGVGSNATSSDGTGMKPVPDPTTMTTAQLNSAINNLRELIGTRIDGIDKATELRLQMLHDAPGQIKDEIAHLKELILEKFDAVNTRFLERDTRTEQAAQESRISLDAALAAAKEAVGEQNKSNTEKINVAGLVTQKQIDSLTTLMQTSNDSLTDKIEDLKSVQAALSARIDRGEAGYNGARDNRTERRAEVSTGIAILGAVLLIVAIAVPVILALTVK